MGDQNRITVYYGCEKLNYSESENLYLSHNKNLKVLLKRDNTSRLAEIRVDAEGDQYRLDVTNTSPALIQIPLTFKGNIIFDDQAKSAVEKCPSDLHETQFSVPPSPPPNWQIGARVDLHSSPNSYCISNICTSLVSPLYGAALYVRRKIFDSPTFLTTLYQLTAQHADGNGDLSFLDHTVSAIISFRLLSNGDGGFNLGMGLGYRFFTHTSGTLPVYSESPPLLLSKLQDGLTASLEASLSVRMFELGLKADMETATSLSAIDASGKAQNVQRHDTRFTAFMGYGF